MWQDKKIKNNRLITILVGLLLIACLLFLTVKAKGNWFFVLELRGKKLLMLLTVAYAVGVSTLLFQTLTQNNILTPSLLGYDSLYILLQTSMVFMFGSMGYGLIPIAYKFGIEALLMMFVSILLFTTLFKKINQDITKLILVGVIIGVLFRSINSLLQRLIDPSQFVSAQVGYFAQFTTVNSTVLVIGMIIMGLSAGFIWQMRHELDILMIGKNQAINLGIHYNKITLKILLIIALLISVATALVGPVGFFGLLICALVNVLAPNFYHQYRLIYAVLIASLVLVLGQTVFEHIFGLKAVLSVVIEFFGGLAFIYLVLRKKQY